MKQFLFLLLGLLLFINCNTDEPQLAPVTIVGNWEYARQTESIDGAVIYLDDYENVANCKPRMELGEEDAYLFNKYNTDCTLMESRTGTYNYANGLLITVSTNAANPESAEVRDTLEVEELTAQTMVLKNEYIAQNSFEADVTYRYHLRRVE